MNDPTDAMPGDDATIIRPSAGAVPPPPAPPAAPAGDGGNALAVGSTIAEFEVTRVLGEGGFGIVYLARDHALQRWVALKEYMPASLAVRAEGAQVTVRSERHRETFAAGLKSFINEARLLAQFDHRSLVKVYRFWEAAGTAYMVMPFVEGKTLKDTLRELGQPPDEAWLMALLAPLTEALQVLHDESCYHRDIAPDNIILLSQSGLPLLLDFGAARRVIGDMTQALTVILKPGYAPIEQYAEVPSMKQGPWTDVYALAAVVYYAITGRTPPPSVGRLVSDDYQPLAQLAEGRYSARLLQAVDRALRVKPEDRTASITEFRQDLGLAATGAGAPAGMSDSTVLMSALPATRAQPRTAAPAPDARAAAGRRLWPAVGLGVLLLAGVAGFVLLRPKAPAPEPVAAAPATTTPVVSTAPEPVAAASVPAAPAIVPAQATAPALPVVQPGDVLAQFDQLVAAQTAGFSVSASTPAARLRIDKDDLRFSITSARDGYVQVLLYGPDGELTQLYPNAKARNNRIQANQRLSLPQASWPLKASEPAGLEHFLVVVTAEPRSLQPWALGRDPDYGFLQLPRSGPAEAPPDGLPWLLGRPDCGRPSCSPEYGAARFSVEAVR